MKYKIISNNISLDLPTDLSVSFNIVGFDFLNKNVSDKKYSYTINLPLTPKNNLFFSFANNPNSEDTNRYKSIEVDYYEENILVFEKAKLFLLKVSDTYECSLVYNGEKKLYDILNDNELISSLNDSTMLDWHLGSGYIPTTGGVNSFGYAKYFCGKPQFTEEHYPLKQEGKKMFMQLPYIRVYELLELIATKHGLTLEPSIILNYEEIQYLVLKCQTIKDDNDNNLFFYGGLERRVIIADPPIQDRYVVLDHNTLFHNSNFFIADTENNISAGKSPSQVLCRQDCTGTFSLSCSVQDVSDDFTVKFFRLRNEVIDELEEINITSTSPVTTVVVDSSQKGDIYYIEHAAGSSGVGNETAGINFTIAATAATQPSELTLEYPSKIKVVKNLPNIKIREFVRAICEMLNTTPRVDAFLNLHENTFDWISDDEPIDISEYVTSIKEEIDFTNKTFGKSNFFSYKNELENYTLNKTFEVTGNELIDEEKTISSLPFGIFKPYSETDSLGNVGSLDIREFDDTARFTAQPPAIMLVDTTKQITTMDGLAWDSLFYKYYGSGIDLIVNKKRFKVTLNVPILVSKDFNFKKTFYIKKTSRKYLCERAIKTGTKIEMYLMML